jgi:hypothetical protein
VRTDLYRQELVHGGVPDVLVDAVADAVHLAQVGRDGGGPADLGVRSGVREGRGVEGWGFAG